MAASWHHMLTDSGEHPAGSVAGLEDNTPASGVVLIAGMLAPVSSGERIARARGSLRR